MWLFTVVLYIEREGSMPLEAPSPAGIQLCGGERCMGDGG